MTRIFVTGGSGFIGTNLVQSLLDDGGEVLNFDQKAPLNPDHATHHQTGEILDSEALGSVMQSFQPELVVHLASRCDLDGSSLADYAANTTGVRNILSAIRRARSVKRATLASSRDVHPTATRPHHDTADAPFTSH